MQSSDDRRGHRRETQRRSGQQRQETGSASRTETAQHAVDSGRQPTASGTRHHGQGPANDPNSRPREAPGAGDSTASIGIVRAIAVAFGLLGVLSLYAGAESIYLASKAPIGGSRLQTMGIVALVIGVAYVYAAYGVWTLRTGGWLVGMGLAGIGTLVTLVGLLSGGMVAGLVGLLVNCALGWGLYTNRALFLTDRRDTADGDTATTTAKSGKPTVKREAGGTTTGYASERRG